MKPVRKKNESLTSLGAVDDDIQNRESCSFLKKYEPGRL